MHPSVVLSRIIAARLTHRDPGVARALGEYLVICMEPALDFLARGGLTPEEMHASLARILAPMDEQRDLPRWAPRNRLEIDPTDLIDESALDWTPPPRRAPEPAPRSRRRKRQADRDG